jgi:uncharacterized protein YbjT (DUF2867 family)
MILVVGATGLLGGLITRQLLERGEEVRVLLRENSPAEQMAQQGMATSPRSLVEAGAQPVYGDLKEPDSLAAACAGIQTIITTANSAVRGGDDNPETVEMAGNRSLIDAAKAAGVGHFIFVSAQIADPQSPVPFLAGKGRTEVYLQASGLPYTIIAPNAFMDVWLFLLVGLPVMTGQPVTLVGSGARRHSFVAMADVAAFVLASVGNTTAVNQKLIIGGPEALSFREATAVYERVLGRPIAVQSVPPGTPLPNLSPGAQGMAAAFDTYDSPIEMESLAARYGVNLTPLESFARQTALP